MLRDEEPKAVFIAAHIVYRVFDILLWALTKRTILNRDVVPEDEPYILTTNHLSYFDTPLIYSILGGQGITGWAAEKYEVHWLFGPIVRTMGGVFIQRGEVDRQALTKATRILKSGKPFAIAPEGTRSPTHSLLPGKTGVAFLANLTGVPIVPVGVTGTEHMADDLKHLRRSKLTIQFGEPYYLPPLNREDRNQSLQQNTDEIMCRIAALLPEPYRGVYHDHPRLRELLTEQQQTRSTT